MTSTSTSSSTADDVFSFEHGNYRFMRDGPQRKKTGSKLSDIIQTLYSEHQYFEFLLQALEREAAKLKPRSIPDYHLLRDILDYLTHYPDQYHHPREDMLFSQMLKRDAKFQKKLDRLLREHETLHYYNRQLLDELSRIADGGTFEQVALRQDITLYIENYRRHMEYESKEIFPQARGTLGASDMKQLAKKTSYIDDPLFGGSVQEQYRRLSRKMRGDASGAGELSAIEALTGKAPGAKEIVNELRKSFVSAGIRSLRRGLNPREACSSIFGGPSWQAKLMTTVLRNFVKPMMQFGDLESMRQLQARMDGWQERSQPEDIRVKPVKSDDYRGEWIRIAGKRAQRTVLYFPGGAFVMRTKVGHRIFVARICRAAKARALMVHYRLAPETPFPGGLEDCLAAYHDLLLQGIDPGDITIAGDSAGGGLVFSTLLALRDEGSPMPANAVVLSPLGDLTHTVESREFNAELDPMLPQPEDRASNPHAIYMGDAEPGDRYLSPVRADFEGLPPVLGQVGSTEILLDDTVHAALQAEKAGVPFNLEIWNEMPHVFPFFAMLPESDIAMGRIGRFIIDSELDELPEKYGSNNPDTGRPRSALQSYGS